MSFLGEGACSGGLKWIAGGGQLVSTRQGAMEVGGAHKSPGHLAMERKGRGVERPLGS